MSLTILRYILAFIFVGFSLNAVVFLGDQSSSLLAAKTAYAQSIPEENPSSNFSTSLTTTYRVNEGGRTRIEQVVKIKNLKPLFAVSQYALQVNSPNISDVKVFKGENPNATNVDIPFQAISTQTSTSIAITFIDQVVGEGKERIFTISYTDPDAAIISGSILELAIPQIQEPQAYSEYTVNIITPIQYGTPSKVNPSVFYTQLTEEGFQTSFSTKPSKAYPGTNSHFTGVNAIFGTEQIFDIELSYHLDNPHSSVRLAQIALPPDTQYQRVLYNKLEPMPKSIHRDLDGNWIATYHIPANSTISMQASLSTQVTLDPNFDVLITQPSSAHTRSAEYWQTQSSVIQELAKTYTNAREIYFFVTNALTYNHEIASGATIRKGAEAVLQNPLQALCQEFSDVFITLARANNIPARRLTGYAHTENTVLRPLSFVEDILHSWAEYFDTEKGHWVPVDPTWGSTSGGINYFDQLDLNHVVFAINGESSQRPYPAGSYKISQLESKDVSVSFGSDFILPEPDFSFSVYTPPISWLPLFEKPSLRITNTTNTAHYNQSFQITTNNPSVELWLLPAPFFDEYTKTITALLPFQTASIPLIALDHERILPGSSTIQVSYENTELEIITYPYYWRWFFNPFVVIGLVGFVISSALIAGSVLVFRPKWQGLIRWQSQKS